MNITKKIINFTLAIILLLNPSIIGGETAIPFRNMTCHPKDSNQLEKSILTSTAFQMNHSFSLSTSIINGSSHTIGIYSNFSKYKFSENLGIKMGLHLIQNPSMQYFSSKFQPQIGYDLNLEYKLSPNSFLNLQISNYNQTLNSFNGF